MDEQELALEIGKVAGALTQIDERLGGILDQAAATDTRLSSLELQMVDMNAGLNRVVEQQKIANGRTSRLERKINQLADRVGLLEQWRKAMTVLPRLLDRWAERPFWALPLSAAIGSATTFAVVHLLGG